MHKLRGSVVTAEVAEKVLKKEMVDPTNGKKLMEKDFIYIQRVFSKLFHSYQIHFLSV